MTKSNDFCYGCFQKTESDPCPFCGYRRNTPQHSASCLSPGTLLNGQYLIGKTLGQGGFGITYLGYDLNLDFKVAIKEYMPEGIVTRNLGSSLVSVYSGEKQESFDFGVSKFLEEARILARFTFNTNIVSVRTFFKENGTAYFVMDYVDGMSLKEYIRSKGGKVTFEQALHLMTPVMEAMEDVHKKDLLHRDISPDNIYITKDGQVRLLDFGAARYTLNEHSKSLSVILKPGFAPEEQYRSRGKQGPWSDVYSLAATIYVMITGRTLPEALDRIHDDDLIPPSLLGVSIPDYAEMALLKALEVSAAKRIQSMHELLTALNGKAADIPVEAVPLAVGFSDTQNEVAVVSESTEDKTIITNEATDRTVAVEGATDRTVAVEGAMDRTVAVEGAMDRTVAVEGAMDRTVAVEGAMDRTVAVQNDKTVAVSAQPSFNSPQTKKSPSVFLFFSHLLSKKSGRAIAVALMFFIVGIAVILIVKGLGSAHPSTTDLDSKSGSNHQSSAFASGSIPGETSEDDLPASEISGTSPESGGASSGAVNSGKSSASSSLSVSQNPVDSSPETIGNTANNLVNYGVATMQGDWIYYINTNGTKIRKMRADGTEKSDVLSVTGAQSLNVIGEWVYFINGSDNLRPYKVKTDGTGLTKLCDDSAEELIATKDWIYYNDISNAKIRRMKTDGSSNTIIADNAYYCSFNYLNHTIYYSDSTKSNMLCKKKADGSDTAVAINSVDTYLTNLIGNVIYFSAGGSDSSFYKVGTGGEGQTRICTIGNTAFNISGNYIYFNEVTDDMCLYRMDISGNAATKQKLTTHRAFCLSIVGNWIFFQYDAEGTFNYSYYKMHLDGSDLQPVD